MVYDPATELCDAAAKADVVRLRFLVRDNGYDVNTGDYDARTACHLAASEGLLDTLHCLVSELGADHSPQDRWGGTPLDDALRGVMLLKGVTAAAPIAHRSVSDGAKGRFYEVQQFLQSKGAKHGLHAPPSASGAGCVLQ